MISSRYITRLLPNSIRSMPNIVEGEYTAAQICHRDTFTMAASQSTKTKKKSIFTKILDFLLAPFRYVMKFFRNSKQADPEQGTPQSSIKGETNVQKTKEGKEDRTTQSIQEQATDSSNTTLEKPSPKVSTSIIAPENSIKHLDKKIEQLEALNRNRQTS